MVWEALRDQLPDDAALFHSVNLLDGNREQEIDLLVAWPGVGLAAIEVKGGRISRDGDGWHQESGGQRRRISSPVVQAQNGRHALTRYLERHASAAARSRAAHLVVFPFTWYRSDGRRPTAPEPWSSTSTTCPTRLAEFGRPSNATALVTSP